MAITKIELSAEAEAFLVTDTQYGYTRIATIPEDTPELIIDMTEKSYKAGAFAIMLRGATYEDMKEDGTDWHTIYEA